ncbi:hypothetical protein ZOSMA_19G00640 [Zostera marina]|uniref:APO domain-containing protein n=1 Tax=Zostera marina TaxID=29655 RepID=A0A0K9PQH9_ZOSMR|nr:hypothetical protein ZOSMA_19G00640 [Zostera marina]
MISARVVYQELRSFITSSYISKISVNPFCSSSIGGGREEDVCSDVPRPGKKWERKPYPTPMKTLIRRAKSHKQLQKENPCSIIEKASDNGLLVSELQDFNCCRTLYPSSKLPGSNRHRPLTLTQFII